MVLGLAADIAIGGLCSSYVNAGNLGVPVAIYVLGDGAFVAPVLLFQLLILAPVAFVMLDHGRAGGRRRRPVAAHLGSRQGGPSAGRQKEVLGLPGLVTPFGYAASQLQ